MSDFQSYLQKRVAISARRLGSVGVVDKQGRDREDYRSLLNLHVLEKLHAVDNDIANGEEGKARWVSTLLRHKSSDYHRKLTVANYTFERIPDLPGYTPVAGDFEQQLINTDLLRRLRTVLAVADWSLLSAYLENGTVHDTWLATKPEISEGEFGKRLRKLFRKCRKKIQNITK